MREKWSRQRERSESLQKWGWLHFKEKRLACVSLSILILMFCSAIFAPLLANNKPYFLHASYPGFFADSFQTLLSHGRELLGMGNEDSSIPETPGEKKKAFGQFVQQAEKLQALLDPKCASSFEDGIEIFQQAVGNKGIDVPNAEKALEALTREFGGEVRGMLKPVWRFPLFSGLHPMEIFLAGLALVFGAPLCLRLLFWRGKGKKGARPAFLLGFAALVLLLPLIGLLLGTGNPDSLNYRSEIENESILLSRKIFPCSVLFPPVPFSYDENCPAESSLPPSGKHLLGTDDTGRDVLSRLVWGGRVSLFVALASTFLLLLIGTTLGSLAGYFRGKVDFLVSRFIEVVICFPVFFLILAIIAFLGPSLINILVVLGLTRWTGIARLVRAEFLRLSSSDFVVGAKALGVPSLSIIFRHMLPNALAPALVLANFLMASSILIESALSFLGLGTVEPAASWGGLVAIVRQNELFSCWWLVLFPGLAIFLTVTCTNLVGEAVREALNPMEKR